MSIPGSSLLLTLLEISQGGTEGFGTPWKNHLELQADKIFLFPQHKTPDQQIQNKSLYCRVSLCFQKFVRGLCYVRNARIFWLFLASNSDYIVAIL